MAGLTGAESGQHLLGVVKESPLAEKLVLTSCMQICQLESEWADGSVMELVARLVELVAR